MGAAEDSLGGAEGHPDDVCTVCWQTRLYRRLRPCDVPASTCCFTPAREVLYQPHPGPEAWRPPLSPSEAMSEVLDRLEVLEGAVARLEVRVSRLELKVL